jgi:hypothetical protein
MEDGKMNAMRESVPQWLDPSIGVVKGMIEF